MKELLRFISFCLILCFSGNLFAQKRQVVQGESRIRLEGHISENEAKEQLIELAKIDALIKEYGQYIERESDLALENGKVGFRSYGKSKVKGEWIRTIGEPQFSFDTRPRNGFPEQWISCKIKGEARKVIPKANVQTASLSCPELQCRTEQFLDGERYYLQVKAPVNGYLSVFLDDGEKVYRLLPYRAEGAKKSVEILGDKDYILFSEKQNAFSVKADDMEVFTSKERELNTIVVVFSETNYQKPILYKEQTDKDGYITPKSLSRKAFEKWLGENRAAYPDFLDIRKRIVISARD